MPRKSANFPALSSTRRRFLAAGLGGGVTVLAGGLLTGIASRRLPLAQQDLARAILEVTPAGPGILALAKFILKNHEELSAETAVKRITEGWPLERMYGERDIRARLQQQIAQEYRDGRMEAIGGWYYALTEIWVMALYGASHAD